jgi:cysteinyl-tRNA synthetase
MVEDALSVTPFARRMLHVGAVSKDGTKMAKSTGNLTLVADLLETAPAAAVRLLLLDRRWSDGWEFRPELLVAATDALHELYAAAARPGGTDAAQDEVSAALLDDLDVPRALAVATEAGGGAGRLLIRVLSLG